MRVCDIHEIIFQIICSRTRRDSHCLDSLQHTHLKRLIKSVTKQFQKEPTLLRLNCNPKVVGDLHGNIDSLLQIFQCFNYPPYQTYLFLGDYVDRGQNSIEVLLLLYSLKLLFPDNVYILRGNHESKQITRLYGFKDECRLRLNHHLYSLFCKSFSHMPIAATINQSIFCVHGGLSPSISDLSEIEEIEKPIPDLSCSIASDLLWSDPVESEELFAKSGRGVGYLFNSDAIAQFLEDNQLKHIIRAHEFCESGFKWVDNDCLTVFSSFDYMGRKNDAAIAVISGNDISTVVLKKLANSALLRLPMPEWLISGEESVKKEPVPSELMITESVELDTPFILFNNFTISV